MVSCTSARCHVANLLESKFAAIRLSLGLVLRRMRTVVKSTISFDACNLLVIEPLAKFIFILGCCPAFDNSRSCFYVHIDNTHLHALKFGFQMQPDSEHAVQNSLILRPHLALDAIPLVYSKPTHS